MSEMMVPVLRKNLFYPRTNKMQAKLFMTLEFLEEKGPLLPGAIL